MHLAFVHFIPCNLTFEEVYADIIDRAFLPALKGPIDTDRSSLLEILQKAIDGKVIIENL